MARKPVANITESLRGHVVPIDSLKPHPQNPRRGDVTAIAESLKRFGQLKPIVVQASTGLIAAGNHTWKAAQQLGWPEVAAVAVDLSDDETVAYVLADNRTADRAEYDDGILAPLLERAMQEQQLTGIGYSPDDVDDLLSELGLQPEANVESDADYSTSRAELDERYGDRNHAAALRQFVLLYPEDVAADVEENTRKLKTAWGVDGMRDVVAEALRMAVEGL